MHASSAVVGPLLPLGVAAHASGRAPGSRSRLGTCKSVKWGRRARSALARPHFLRFSLSLPGLHPTVATQRVGTALQTYKPPFRFSLALVTRVHSVQTDIDKLTSENTILQTYIDNLMM